MKNFLAIILFLTSTTSFAEDCNYGDAQKLLVKFNNLMQIYNREMLSQMEKTGSVNAELEQTRTSMAEESAELGIALGKEYDNNPQLSDKTPINPDICKGYRGLLSKYAVDNKTPAAVNLKPAAEEPNCDSNSLWQRYGKAIQKQQALTAAGKISKTENEAYMPLTTYIGQYATTDLKKACEYMQEFEDKLNSH